MTKDEKGILFFSDLHCGSIFGMLPPGFVNSAETIINQSPGQQYLWECWMDLKKRLPQGLVAAISNGDMLDGKQEAQKGTELILPRWEDQRKAAQETIQALELEIPIYFTQGCLMPGHKVLTADLRWKPVENLSVGDALLTVKENEAKWEIAAVTAHIPVRKECVEVLLETGETFCCTSDHPLLVYNGNARVWIPAGQLRASSRLARMLPMWNELTSKEAGYVAGFFDSEGSLDYGVGHGALRISAAQRPNVVISKVMAELEAEQYRFTESGHYKNTDCKNYSLRGGQHEALRFLGSYRPPRLLSKFKGPSKLGRQRAVEHVCVKAVRRLGQQEVVGMSTTSRTYLADGFAHHNTEYHDSKGGSEVEALAWSLDAVKYRSLGTGVFSKEVINLEIDGVVINAAHGISGSGGLYRATAPDREGIWSALAGKEGKMPKADCVVRSHVHYYVHVEYPTKHIVITPCWELQTRFMRRNSIYRFIPDIGAVIIWVDGQAKKQGEDPIRIQKILYDLPKLNTTKL